MARYRGLTWDHPRGRVALERSAAGVVDGTGEPLIGWDVHPLEGFEASSIAELAARYDVIVLDHPHLGDALATGSLLSLESVFPADWLAALEESSTGPSLRSYRLDGSIWALPLDAATQVSVRLAERPDAVAESWAEVAVLSRAAPVALSLAGPHAFLSFASLCVTLGEEPSVRAASDFVSAETGAAALGILSDIASRMPAGTAGLNPIGMLERMRSARDIAFIPLIYGYVNYSDGADAGSLRFGDAPAAVPGGRRGSTIGGTGIALSARTDVSAELVGYLRWLLDPVTQATYIPDNAGQPSNRLAWSNASVNHRSGGFYLDTSATVEQSWVRPRFAGFTPVQSRASALLRSAILEPVDDAAAIAALNDLFRHFPDEGPTG